MSKRVHCKFFAHGACLKGEHCAYSHDWKDPPDSLCTFYQKGTCAYGSRCRYKHVNSSPKESDSEITPFIGDDNIKNFMGFDYSDLSICPLAASGECPCGKNCPHIHGDLCPTCAKHCLHPFRHKEREEHLRACEKKQKHEKAMKYSQDIECSVCFEIVLSKSIAAERKFGILSECNHPFCISCIRNWRSSSSSKYVNSALKSCPVCRKLSYFVIPSAVWYSSEEEKKEIVEGYKAKLRSIDCKHFDFGNGTCPFGTACFYKHTMMPGSFLWDDTLLSDFRNLRVHDMNEVESSSGTLDMNSLQVLLENEEVVDDIDESLDNIMAEVMALLPMMQDVDASDSDN